MAYDETLADRVRDVLVTTNGVVERKMFGGVAFMINGHMCCGVGDDELMLRLGPERTAQLLKQPNTRPMDFTGKIIKSMLYVTPAGIRTKSGLTKWVRRAVDFASQLPPK